MKYLIIKTVKVKDEFVVVDHLFDTLNDSLIFIKEWCNEENIISVEIKYIQCEKSNNWAF